MPPIPRPLVFTEKVNYVKTINKMHSEEADKQNLKKDLTLKVVYIQIFWNVLMSHGIR